MRVSHVLLSILLSSLAVCAQSNPTPLASAQERLKAEIDSGIGSRLAAGPAKSLSDAVSAAQRLATYLQERAGLNLSPGLVDRLAAAEWPARAVGQGSISVFQLSTLSTRLFIEKLGGSGATAPPTAGGSSPYYVITPEKFNAARLFFRRNSPQVVASDLAADQTELSPLRSSKAAVQVAYPLEALLALYLCISEDYGRSESSLRVEIVSRANSATNPISAQRKPYGDHGFYMNRPVSQLLTEDILSVVLGLAQ